jgi:release factor glutamine methyltransferase
MQNWTIQKLLSWITDHLAARNVDSPRLSAELLLCRVLRLERIELYTHFNRIAQQTELDQLRELVKRCGDREPVAYLVGRCEFYSLPITVSKDCLIPRPETELLVERAIEFLRGRQGVQYVCDLCTGSGCVAVAIAKNHAQAKIIATDICDSALSVAAENVAKHQLNDRVRLLCGDLFSPVIEGLDETRFDLIVSNPPYVSSAEYEQLGSKVKDFEPKKALFAGQDGLDVYRRIADRIAEHLKDDGALILEIGYAQGKAVRELMEDTKIFSEIKIEKDINNNDRVVTAKKTLIMAN